MPIDQSAGKEALRARGRAIAEAGTHPGNIVVDLDETMWAWALSITEQRRLGLAHWERVYVRLPLVWLLQGMVRHAGGHPVRVWTAGYGYRVDRVCEQVPDLAEVLGLARGSKAEDAAHVVTRLDWVRAVERRPELCPYRGRWVSQKVPGGPTEAGKPSVDAARILLDDKETNCRRFVGAGRRRSAIWLRSTRRVWGETIRLGALEPPPGRTWVEDVASALTAIGGGEIGLFVAEPRPTTGPPEGVDIRLPHRRAWRDWIAPGRRLRRLVAGGIGDRLGIRDG